MRKNPANAQRVVDMDIIAVRLVVPSVQNIVLGVLTAVFVLPVSADIMDLFVRQLATQAVSIVCVTNTLATALTDVSKDTTMIITFVGSVQKGAKVA